MALAAGSVMVITSGTAGAAAPAAVIGAPTRVNIPSGDTLNDIACATANQCYAIGDSGGGAGSSGVVIPIVNGQVGAVTAVANTTDLYGIACPTSTLCEVVGDVDLPGGATIGIEVDLSSGTPIAVTRVAGTYNLSSIACSDADRCYATESVAGFDFANAAIVPIIDTDPQPPVNVSTEGYLPSISCASSTSCLAVGAVVPNCPSGCTTSKPVEVPITNGVIGTTVGGLAPTHDRFTDVACIAGPSCEIVSSDTAGTTEDSTGGGLHPFANGVLSPSTQNDDIALSSIACPLSGLCIGVGSVGSSATGSGSETYEYTAASVVNGVLGADVDLGVGYTSAMIRHDLHLACPSPSQCIAVGDVVLLVPILVPTVTALTASANPTAGQPVTLDATVSGPEGATTPTGTVTFTDTTTGANLGTSGLNSSGDATVTTAHVQPGTHVITARYSGSSTDLSSSATLTEVVSLAATTTTVSALIDPQNEAHSAAFHATVTSPDTTDPITGAVTFTDQRTGIVLGASALSSSGTAIVSTSALSVGQHTIIATYSGDALHAISQGTASQTVDASPTPGLAHLPSTFTLAGVGCGSPTSCVVVGTGPSRTGGLVANVITLNTSTGAFGVASVVANAVDLTGIACVTAADCIAVGVGGPAGNQGVLVPISNGTPGAVQLVAGTSELTGVTCIVNSDCTAVGVNSAGSTGITVGVGLGGAGAVTAVPGSATLNGIACVSTTSCVAVGGDAAGNGIVVPIVNGSAGTPRAVNDYTTLNAVVCPASTTCMAVGQDDRDQVGVLLPVGLSSVGTAVVDSNANSLTGIACASTTSCVAVGQGGAVPAGLVVPVQNGAFGIDLLVPGTFAFTGIGCDTSTTCTAVGQDIGEGVAVPVTIGGGGGGTLIQTLKKSSTTVGSSLNPATYGTPVTFTATVTPPANGVTPTGAVTFTDTTTGATLGAATLDGSGKAALSVSTLAVGTHTVNAAYSGDANNNASSGTITETVNKAPTKLAALAAKTSTHSFTAVLSRSDSGGAISGQTITFTTRNAFTKKQDVVCSAVTNSDGLATCSHAVPAGDLFDTSYTATYAGTGNYLNSVTTAKLSL